MIKTVNFLFLFSFLCQNISAQSDLIEKHSFNLKADESIYISLPLDLSSLAIKSKNDLSFLKIQIDNEEIDISANGHVEDEFIQTTNLIFPIKDSKELIIHSENNSDLELYILKVPTLDKPIARHMASRDSCDKPNGIDQDIWRLGLSPPIVPPTLNQVNHCIIHHSAGSNTATDYTEVVRNIYVFHTGVNGWDDIGYNYLISQDGTLYHGRDGQNLYSDDNVRGAHYCGKNTGTMGVCLLGDYTVAVPSLAALQTLENLLLWKLNKESLLPKDSARHPIPGGAFLGRVAGHQDGCATACPGTFLYADIPAIIDSLDERINNCNALSMDDKVIENNQLNIYPKPSRDYVKISSQVLGTIYLYDSSGKMIYSADKRTEEFRLKIDAYPEGSYLIKLVSRDRHLKGKLLIMH